MKHYQDYADETHLLPIIGVADTRSNNGNKDH